METHFQFFEDENLFVIKYTGEFSIEDYSKQVIESTKKQEWSFVKKILVDIRLTKIKTPIKKISELIDIKESKLSEKELVTVHLVETPSETVASHLYQARLKEKKFNLNYCSTIEKAKELLNFSKSSSELEFRINNLNCQF